MASAFDPDAFDPANPAAFYLGDEELVQFADSVWVVQGTELPVCIGVVALHSPVLLGANSAEREGVTLGPQARYPWWAALLPPWRKRTERAAAAAGPPRVRLTIEGCSVKEAALFLRFLYHPEQITSVSMGKLGGDLAAVGGAS